MFNSIGKKKNKEFYLYLNKIREKQQILKREKQQWKTTKNEHITEMCYRALSYRTLSKCPYPHATLLLPITFIRSPTLWIANNLVRPNHVDMGTDLIKPWFNWEKPLRLWQEVCTSDVNGKETEREAVGIW